MLIRDLDVAVPNALDGLRLEVVADFLPLFGGAQLAVDTTLVSPLHADGCPHRHAADSDGAVLATARRRKERTYPEVVGPENKARLVFLALETRGRWFDEAMAFVRLLARATVRSEPRILKKRVEQAWRLRWLSMLDCAAARVLAASFLELRSSGGADGPTPLSHEVEGDHRYSCLDLSCACLLFWPLWSFVSTILWQKTELKSLGWLLSPRCEPSQFNHILANKWKIVKVLAPKLLHVWKRLRPQWLPPRRLLSISKPNFRKGCGGWKSSKPTRQCGSTHQICPSPGDLREVMATPIEEANTDLRRQGCFTPY